MQRKNRPKKLKTILALAGIIGVFIFFWIGGADLLAQIGYAPAQYKKGYDLFSSDPLRAAYWFRQAADKNHAQAQYRLGLSYEKGLIGDVDFDQARFWYRKAAARDHARARYRLGRIYEKGIGVQPDAVEAKRYYRAAAAQGLAEAQWSYAMIEYPRSALRARKWLKKAADQGHVAAQNRLGRLEQERGLHKEAYIWYALAARFGLRSAIPSRDEVAAQLTPSELVEARAVIQNRFESIEQQIAGALSQ